MEVDKLIEAEQLHATAAYYLLDGEQYQAGELLVLCDILSEPSHSSYYEGSIARDCVKDAPGVVQTFLDILSKNG